MALPVAPREIPEKSRLQRVQSCEALKELLQEAFPSAAKLNLHSEIYQQDQLPLLRCESWHPLAAARVGKQSSEPSLAKVAPLSPAVPEEVMRARLMLHYLLGFNGLRNFTPQGGG